MIWLIIVLAVLLAGVLIYFLLPFFKRLFSNISNRPTKSNHRKEERARLKEQKRLEKRELKEQKKASQSRKPQDETSTKNENVFTAQGDLFSDNENAIELKDDVKEDPDTKINYDNFDLDGLFSENTKQSKDNFEDEVFDKKEEDAFSGNYNELFNKYFSNDMPVGNRSSTDKPVSDRPSDIDPSRRAPLSSLMNKPAYKFSSDGSIDPNEEGELTDFLKENDFSDSGNSDISRTIENMTPEMKALLLSNFLDRKDN